MTRPAAAVVLAIVVVVLLGALVAHMAPPERISRPPWVVALVTTSSPADDPYHGQFCAGVLIAPTSVLTAAHCLVGRVPSSIDAIIGADNLCRGAAIDGVRIAVSSAETHRDFNPETGDADLALLTLSSLATGPGLGMGAASSGLDAVVLGWGTNGPSGATSCRLTQTEVMFANDEECERLLSGTKLAFNPTSMSCARSFGPDTCYGDSGGPAVRAGRSGTSVVGITSWGDTCGGIGVYARVDSWLRR